MKADSIVPEYPLKDKHSGLFYGREMALVNKFSFQRGPQAFGHGIVVGISDGSHRLGNPELLAEEPVVQTRVLAAMIGVEDGAGESVAAPGEGSGPEGVHTQLGPQVGGDRPAHDPPRADVLNAGQVAEALIGSDVGHVAHVEPVQLGCGEAALHQVRSRCGLGVATRRDHLSAPTDALNTDEAHQACDPLAVDLHPLPPELGRDPRDAVAAPGLRPDVVDPVGQPGLLDGGLVGAGVPGGHPVVERRPGHLTYPAQGLDVEVGPLGVDEAVDPHSFDSFTQKTTARFKISRSFSSSAMRFFNRRFSCISASSGLGAGPVNLAFLRSSRTQFPRVASSTPSSRAMCATGRPEDRTSATASRLNSGVYCCMNTSSLQPWRLVQGVSGRRGEVHSAANCWARAPPPSSGPRRAPRAALFEEILVLGWSDVGPSVLLVIREQAEA